MARLPRFALAPAVLLLAVGLAVPVLSSADPLSSEWTPGPTIYDVAEINNVPVTMDDGTVLRADVFYPVDRATKKAATGPFPVILTQTPYGKTISGYVRALAGAANPYLIERGYIHVIADIRGTGGSQGSWGPLDPIQAKDGAALVRWASELPNSNGRVGTTGPSYLGLIQLMTAAEIGPDSPLKAIFPIVAGADLYRDVIFQGGIVDIEFAAWYLPLMVLANMGNPILELASEPQALPKVELDHTRMLTDFHASIVSNILTNGDQAFHGDYWNERTPSGMIQRIVDNNITAFLVGGWRDLFQRGTPLLYSGFQNAYAGRSVDAPMEPAQAVTGRYQLLMGPWYHVQYGEGIDLDPIMLRWFDTWLKDAPTGMADEPAPFHTYEMGSGRLLDVARYPVQEATPTTYFLDEGGMLSTAVPTAAAGEDTVVFTGVSNPCTLSTQQWGAGALILAGALPAPCGGPEPISPPRPAALSYTSTPFGADTVLAGPIGATLYATSTRPDTELIVTLYDVAPGGSATQISSGALLGSFRQLDAERTWGSGDRPIRPWHPYTRDSVQPVIPGEVTRLDIEVFPTFTHLAAGHQLRVTITTSDVPHLLPIPAQMINLLGGVYRVQRNANAASSIQVPLAPASAFGVTCEICG